MIFYYLIYDESFKSTKVTKLEFFRFSNQMFCHNVIYFITKIFTVFYSIVCHRYIKTIQLTQKGRNYFFKSVDMKCWYKISLQNKKYRYRPPKFAKIFTPLHLLICVNCTPNKPALSQVPLDFDRYKNYRYF